MFLRNANKSLLKPKPIGRRRPEDIAPAFRGKGRKRVRGRLNAGGIKRSLFR